MQDSSSNMKTLRAKIMKYRLSIAAAVTLAASGVLAQGNAAQSSSSSGASVMSGSQQSSVLSMQQLYDMVNKPAVPLQIMENIKFAMDHGLFLRDEFYTSENFNHFFAAAKIEKDWFVPTRMDGRTMGFEPSIDPPEVIGPGSIKMQALHMKFSIKINPEGSMDGYVWFSSRSRPMKGLNFDSMTKLFGPGWKYGKEPFSVHPLPPTIYIEYDNCDFEFRPDKTFEFFYFHFTVQGVK